MQRIKFDEETIKNMSNTSVFGVYVYQEDGRFVFVNDAFCRFVEYSKDELLNKDIKLLDLVKDEHKKHVQKIIEKRISGDFFAREFEELVYVSKNKQEKTVLNFGYTIIYKGKPSGFVITVDITKQKTYKMLYKGLSKVNQLVSELKNEEAILKEICRVLNEDVGFDLVCVGTIDSQTKLFKEKYISGKQSYIDIFRKINISVDENLQEGQGSVGRAYREQKIVAINNVFSDEGMSAWRDAQKKFGIYSACSIPIFKGTKLAYILIIYSKIPNIFSSEYLYLVKSLQHSIINSFERLENEKWKTILSNTLNIGFDFVIIMKQNGDIVFLNENTKKMLQYTEEKFTKKNILDVICNYNKKELETLFKSVAIDNIYKMICLKTKLNDIKKMLVHITKVDADETYFIMTGKDITHNLELQKSIENVLKRDITTNLLNRYAFIEAAEGFIEKAEYNTTMGAVVVVKPLRFSEINEALGFEKGDELLIKIANRLRTFTKRLDSISRLDSAKFAVLLQGAKREEDILIVVIELIKELTKPYSIDGKRFDLSFNAGISIYPHDSKDAKALLEKAEIALIDARNKGENEIGFYKERLKQETAKRVKLNQEFPQALKNKEFALYFQPYFDIKTQKPKGAEVLIRWLKDGNTIPPSEFIPIFEQNRNIAKLEEYILDEAIAFIKNFDNKERLIPLSINLTPTSLADDDFVDSLILKTEELSQFINIEITERLFLGNMDYARSVLSRIRNNGFRVYMDDFGTGYSSLSYLSSLPIDCIKIDMSFVKGLMESKKVKSIVKTIIYLAKELNMSTIAEGVETEKHLDALKNMGCQMAQGFLFAKPLEIKDFIDFLNKYGS